MHGLAAAALLALVVSGCAAPPPSQPETVYVTAPHAENARPPRPPCMTFAGNAPMVAAGLQPPAFSYTDAPVVDAAARLEVPAGVAAILLDLSWDSGLTTGIHAEATRPDGTVESSHPQAAASAQAPLRLRFDEPLRGTWQWRAVADTVVLGADVHFREGLYYEPPEALGFGCNGNVADAGPADR
jgi:hypothetical protein